MILKLRDSKSYLSSSIVSRCNLQHCRVYFKEFAEAGGVDKTHLPSVFYFLTELSIASKGYCIVLYFVFCAALVPALFVAASSG